MSRYTNETTAKVVGRIKNDTGKAIRVIVKSVNGNELVEPKSEWFPLSQVIVIDGRTDPCGSTITIKEWIVNQKEFVYKEPELDSEHSEEDDSENKENSIWPEDDIPF